MMISGRENRMQTEGMLLDIAMTAARCREDRDGTPWRETLGEAWLLASSRDIPRRADSMERRIEEISTATIDADVEEVDATVASDLHDDSGPEEGLKRRDLSRLLSAELLRLPPRVERMLRQRYGLGDLPAVPVDEIARLMNVCDGRIHQMVDKALKRLGHRNVMFRLASVAPDAVRGAMETIMARRRDEDAARRRELAVAKPTAPAPACAWTPPPQFWRLGPGAQASVAARYGYDLSRASA